MKLALFADLHSNLEALSACLQHARALGADRFAFLGDLIGYGADPVAVLQIIEEQAAMGAVVVLGNHDATAIGRPADPLNASAQAAIDWTRSQLRPSDRAFLTALPLTVRDRDLLFVHASAVAPEQSIYITGPVEAARSMIAGKASRIFCGHVHESALYFKGVGDDAVAVALRPVPGTSIPVEGQRQWLAIVGSTGQPRDGNRAASYAMADLERNRLTFFRIPYDHALAAEKIRAAGLPERLALRLEHGT